MADEGNFSCGRWHGPTVCLQRVGHEGECDGEKEDGAVCNKLPSGPGLSRCKRVAGHAGQCANAVKTDYESPVDTIRRVTDKAVHIEPEKEVKGGRVNYYLCRILFPQREEQPPYTAECEDIIDALGLTPDEANIFKEIWRSANARKGNGKPDHKALYGAQKIVHYAGRILRKLTRG